MSILDALSQAGGWLGTAGAGVAGWVATKVHAVEVAAEKAIAARDAAEAILKLLRAELEALDALKRGIRLEIDNAKHTHHDDARQSSHNFEPGAPTTGG